MSFTIFPEFFAHDTYFIDEKVNLFKFENAYKVYDTEGRQIGNIVQKLSGWQKMLRLIIDKKVQPFTLDITDMNGTKSVTIKRGWTFFMSKITILDANAMPIGYIRQKFKLFKPVFHVLDAAEQNLAEIKGDWAAWDFTIKDDKEMQIGTISKKWNGALKEIFTTADKYVVSIAPECREDIKKVAIVASAITIDMVLKESK